MVDEADHQPIELLDGRRAVTTTELKTGPNPARTVLIAVAVVVGAAILAWSLISTGPTNGDDATDQSEPGPAEDAAPQTTVTRPTTTTTARVGGPLLGEASGLWLFHGGEGPLQRLDLDTGVIDRYGLRAWPLAAIGDELVVTAEGSGSIGWVSLENPGEQAAVWTRATAARSDQAGHVWLLTDDPAEWTLIDVMPNRTVERLPVSAQVFAANQTTVRQRHLVPDNDLIETANGIYQDDGAGYRRVTTGRLLDFDVDRALVEQCAETLGDCSLRWFARPDWQSLDLPVPETPISSGRLVGGGSWLLAIKPDGTTSELVALDDERRFSFDGVGDALTVSPDGRWAAYITDDGLMLLDLTTGSVVQHVAEFAPSRDGVLLFVER